MKVILLALFVGVAVAQHYGENSGYGPDGVRNRYFILGHGKVGPIATSLYGPSLGSNSYRPSSSGHASSLGGYGGSGGSSLGHSSRGSGYRSGISSGIYGPSVNNGGHGGYGSSSGHGDYGSSSGRGGYGSSLGHGGYGSSLGHGGYGSSLGHGSSGAYESPSSHGAVSSYRPSSVSHGYRGPSHGSQSSSSLHGVNSHGPYGSSSGPSSSYSGPSVGHGVYGTSPARGGYGSGHGSYGNQHDLAQPTPYEFGYNVHNEHGDQINRQESGDGHGNVKGSYGYRDGYGIFRHVDYTADHGGFRANVRTNEPGTDNQDPADVHMQVEHGGYGGAQY